MRRFSVRLVNKLVTQTTSTLCFSTVGNGTFEKNLVKELGLTDTDHVCKLLRVSVVVLVKCKLLVADWKCL